MKSHKLKDAGKRAFPVPPLAVWSGFGAVDGDRVLEIHVEDIVLQQLDPTSTGSDHTKVLEAHRSKILEIAAGKYEHGCVVGGNIGLPLTTLQLAFVSLIHSANDRPNEKPRRCERSRALGDDGECPDVRAVKARAGTIRTGVNIEHESGGMRSDTAMDRNADRQSRIAEDLARLLALRNAIYDCKSAVNQSLAVIDSTLDAIALLYRLQHPRPPDAGPEPHGSAPAPRASQTTASE